MKNYMRSEATEQIAVVQWCKINEFMCPELELIHHIPNGGKRSRSESNRFKQMGVKAGVPDLFLPVARHGYHGLYIEMKYGDGKTSKAQKEYIANVRKQGYLCQICNGAEEAVTVIKKYMNI